MANPAVAQRLDWAEDVAGRVGTLLMGSFRTGLASRAKASGIVTELDARAEQLISDELRAAFPGDGILGEEGTDRESTSGYRWIVDPLDGTTNYVCGLPHFAVSLACLSSTGVKVGVVRSPAATETFLVADGEPARGPDGPLRVRDAADIEDAVLLLNKCYLPFATLWGATERLLGRCRAVRYHGCISLDLAYVAAGRVDGLVLLPAPPWDTAAGAALLEPAGAGYCDLDGQPVPPGRQAGIVAAAPELLKQVLALVDFKD